MIRVACALLVAACGAPSVPSATATMALDTVNGSLYIVITASQSDITSFEDSAVGTTNPPGAYLTVIGGDHHEGDFVCATDAAKNGDTAHMTVYSTLLTTVPASTCAQLKQSIENG